jgi:hypothetical protein
MANRYTESALYCTGYAGVFVEMFAVIDHPRLSSDQTLLEAGDGGHNTYFLNGQITEKPASRRH